MYAVIETGGKQYRVQEGDVLRVEKLNAEVGEKVALGRVLMVKDDGAIALGSEAEKADVVGIVEGHGRGKKIIVFKKRRRKNYRRTKGHRQSYTSVRIEKINWPGAAQAAGSTAEKE